MWPEAGLVNYILWIGITFLPRHKANVGTDNVTQSFQINYFTSLLASSLLAMEVLIFDKSAGWDSEGQGRYYVGRSHTALSVLVTDAYNLLCEAVLVLPGGKGSQVCVGGE